MKLTPPLLVGGFLLRRQLGIARACSALSFRRGWLRFSHFLTFYKKHKHYHLTKMTNTNETQDEFDTLNNKIQDKFREIREIVVRFRERLQQAQHARDAKIQDLTDRIEYLEFNIKLGKIEQKLQQKMYYDERELIIAKMIRRAAKKRKNVENEDYNLNFLFLFK